MADALIVLSGGMDSTTLLADEVYRGSQISALSFNYGAKHNQRELPLAAAACRTWGVNHQIIELPFIDRLFASSLLSSGDAVPDGAYDSDNMKSTVVPFRNGILLSIAVGYAESIGAKRVLIASHAGDHFIYPDCRPQFNLAFAQAAKLGTDGKVEVAFPFSGLDKRAIGDLGRKRGVDFSQTWTCYKGGDIHCGTCGACDERKYGLRYSEGLDPTVYAK